MVYCPGEFTSTLPEELTETAPAQLSLAVAPGSTKLVWHSTVNGLAPLTVMTGGVLSATVTVVVHWLLLLDPSVAVTVIVCGPSPTMVPAAGLCESVIEPDEVQLSETVTPPSTFGTAA
jgi:hypothetical protein